MTENQIVLVIITGILIILFMLIDSRNSWKRRCGRAHALLIRADEALAKTGADLAEWHAQEGKCKHSWIILSISTTDCTDIGPISLEVLSLVTDDINEVIDNWNVRRSELLLCESTIRSACVNCGRDRIDKVNGAVTYPIVKNEICAQDNGTSSSGKDSIA